MLYSGHVFLREWGESRIKFANESLIWPNEGLQICRIWVDVLDGIRPLLWYEGSGDISLRGFTFKVCNGACEDKDLAVFHKLQLSTNSSQGVEERSQSLINRVVGVINGLGSADL